MREVIHSFGAKCNLHGIATIPKSRNFETGILLLNSGVLHKVGPFDLNKEFARYLSTLGYTTFRFDFSGMGDSVKIKSGLSHHESVIKDMKDALDLMEGQYKLCRFVVIGLCTGAENGYKIALADPRVVGNIWLDGYGYSNLKGKWLQYKGRLFDIKRVAKYMNRFLTDTNIKQPETLSDDDEFDWVLPPKNELSQALNRLHERGVKILNIYSGGVATYNSYRDQFKDTFKGQPFLDSMDIEYYPRADHTYKIRKDKSIMLKRVGDWLERSFH